MALELLPEITQESEGRRNTTTEDIGQVFVHPSATSFPLLRILHGKVAWLTKSHSQGKRWELQG